MQPLDDLGAHLDDRPGAEAARHGARQGLEDGRGLGVVLELLVELVRALSGEGPEPETVWRIRRRIGLEREEGGVARLLQRVRGERLEAGQRCFRDGGMETRDVDPAWRGGRWPGGWWTRCRRWLGGTICGARGAERLQADPVLLREVLEDRTCLGWEGRLAQHRSSLIQVRAIRLE